MTSLNNDPNRNWYKVKSKNAKNWSSPINMSKESAQEYIKAGYEIKIIPCPFDDF